MRFTTLVTAFALLPIVTNAQTTLGIDGASGGASINIGGVSLDTENGINMDGISLSTEDGIAMDGIQISAAGGIVIDGFQEETNGSISLGSVFEEETLTEQLEAGKPVNVVILFEFGSAKLTSAGKQQVEAIADAFISLDSELSIVVEGHTDNVGSDEDNMTLSENRALTVFNELKDEHAVDQSLYVVARGEQDPVATNETDEGRSLNRRVTFILQK